jgi:hypothetical protein
VLIEIRATVRIAAHDGEHIVPVATLYHDDIHPVG